MSWLDSVRLRTLDLLSPAGKRARLLVLTYHRVVAQPDPMVPTEPDAQLFAAQMDWLQANCTVLSLPQAAEQLRAGTLPSRAACITFDDGYANNHEVAAPILLARGLPATFFIAIEAVRSGIMWNDLVIEATRRAGAQLDLGFIDLGMFSLDSPATRSAAAFAVLDKLKYRSLNERWDVANDIYARATGEAAPRLMMTPQTVGDMARLGFDMGAHTVYHPILTTLPAPQAQREIEESAEWVERWTGRRPRSFAYPNGRPGRDYDASHVRMVAAAGFEVAVSTRWGCAKSGATLLELPRIAPWERSAGAFWQRLCKTHVASYVERVGDQANARYHEYV